MHYQFLLMVEQCEHLAVLLQFFPQRLDQMFQKLNHSCVKLPTV